MSVNTKRDINAYQIVIFGRPVTDLLCSLRLLLLVAVIFRSGWTFILPALPVPPSPPAAAPLASATSEPPTAGSYRPVYTHHVYGSKT